MPCKLKINGFGGKFRPIGGRVTEADRPMRGTKRVEPSEAVLTLTAAAGAS